MSRALVLLAALALVGCGEKKPDPYAQANTGLLAALPVYPGAAAPKTSASSSAYLTSATSTCGGP